MQATTTSPSRVERSPHLRAQQLGLPHEARSLLFALTPLVDDSVGYAAVTLVALAQRMAEAEGRPWSIAGVTHYLEVLRKNGIVDLDGPGRDDVIAVAIS